MMVVSCSRKMKLLDYYNKVLSYSLIVFLLFVLFHIVLTQRDVRETLPLDKYRSVTAGLMEGGSASQNFVIFFFLDSRANFVEQNLKITIHHPDEIPESSNILCM